MPQFITEARSALVALFVAAPMIAHADLVALYKFDEPTGTSASDSAADHHAAWIPGTASPNWQPAGGVIGGAIHFPGSGAHVNYFSVSSFPEINGTTAGMSIATWFKPTSDNSGYRGIVTSRSVNGSALFGFGHEDDHLDGRVATIAIDSPSGSLTETGGWFHIAWVWNNSTRSVQLFINGTPTGSAKAVAAQTITSNADWRIGDDACCSNRILDGLLDDLAIYDHALSAAEIATLYTNGLDGYSADEIPDPPVTDPLNVGLVINEIYHDAEPKTARVEFVELLNTGPDALDLSGYRFASGIEYVFPPGSMLEVTEYLVLGEDDYGGSLSNESDTLELIDASGKVVDRVGYRAEFPWPIAAGGQSIQLVNATIDNDLGAAWRPAFPTPGAQNQVFAENTPPQLRQADHSPAQPNSGQSTTVSVKATDPDGIGSLTLHYQVNAPGEFVPAFLPLTTSALKNSPEKALPPNPAFEAGWIDVPMATGGGDIYFASLPDQPHRSLVRYRITATDTLGNSTRAPFPDDPSLNFAYFSYDGVPGYLDHPAEILTLIPVYHLITDADDLAQCWAYDPADQVGSVASRKKFNWEGAMVYEGKVYDHIGYRLRQRNDRYIGTGRRSMRFRFRDGNYLAARDPAGNRYTAKWRSMNTSKMSRFVEGANHGMRELVSSRLWNLAGVAAPEFQHVHFRVIDATAEQSSATDGDFYGLSMIFEDVDAQFLENRQLAKGNVYKLKDGESNPLELQKYQARDAVSDGSDFINIRENLGPPTQSDQWLRDHVDWESWYLYAALGEGFRHYDFAPYHQKNRIWYFKPDAATPFGRMSVIPHDTDATWKRGTNDSQWNDPRYGPGPGTQRGRVVGIDLPKEAIQEIAGLDGTDGENHPEREAFMLEYRNVIREVRDLFWQTETVNTVIDEAYETIAAFSPADTERWGSTENLSPVENQIALMKQLAFTEDLYMGSSLSGGRAQWLTNLAADPAIPDKPVISRSAEVLSSSAFSDPQGAGTFQKMQWRIAEVNLPPNEVTLIESGDVWNFFDLGSDPGADWNQLHFDDSAYDADVTKMGYGDEGVQTLLTRGHAAKYFRKFIYIADPSGFVEVNAGIVRDDGAIVYVNGVEVWRNQMPDGPVTFQTLASAPASGSNERDFQPFTIPAELLVAGDNLIAVEVHQYSAASGDMGFDFQLEAIWGDAIPKYEWHASWIGETTASSITPPAVATRTDQFHCARVRHQDSTGRWSHWSDPLEFFARAPDISLFKNSLVISEIMYHPSDPSPAEIATGFTDDDDFEFIEVRNVGDQTIDLSDLRFTKGIDVDLSGTIAPGGFVLVVNNAAAFEMRHGAGLPVLGEWTGKLDNGGERLKLSYGAGIPILDFAYDDAAPWPEDADGGGFSLVLVNPFSIPEHGSPYSWRAGAVTPSTSDATSFTGGDLAAYASRGRVSLVQLPGGDLQFRLSLNRRAEDVAIRFEASTDLADWQAIPATITGSGGSSAGFTPTTFNLENANTSRHFIRLVFELR